MGEAAEWVKAGAVAVGMERALARAGAAALAGLLRALT